MSKQMLLWKTALLVMLFSNSVQNKAYHSVKNFLNKNSVESDSYLDLCIYLRSVHSGT